MTIHLDSEVVIIGAGLSGLQAARILKDSGVRAVVLEARSRVGGKTLSVRDEDGVGVSDLGAEWLNDTTQPRVYQLASELELEFSEVRVRGESILQLLDGRLIRHPYGQQAPLPDNQDEVVERLVNKFEDVYSYIDLGKLNQLQHDEITLEDFVRDWGGGPSIIDMVAVWTRVMLGCEPADLSAAYFFLYCKSQGGLMKMRSSKMMGKYLTIKTGTQSISERLATLLPHGSIRINTVAKSIAQLDDHVEVHDSTGHTFRAKKVLLACSTPLYKKITFSPPLPEGKASLVESTKLGYYTKVLVAYDNPWWRDNGLSGASQSFLGPAAATRDTSEDSLSKFRLTSFIAGEPGRIWSKLPSDKRRMAVLNQLAAMFGSNAAMHVSGYIEMEWSSEEWSMGCPCPFTQPGVLTKVGCYLTEPFGQVHFIGAETASEWKGYMEGALASGSRGAYEVLSCLGQGRRNR